MKPSDSKHDLIIKRNKNWKLEGLKSVFSKRCTSKIWGRSVRADFKKLDSFTLKTSKNHLIRNFLRNGHQRVNFFFNNHYFENYFLQLIYFLTQWCRLENFEKDNKLVWPVRGHSRARYLLERDSKRLIVWEAHFCIFKCTICTICGN